MEIEAMGDAVEWLMKKWLGAVKKWSGVVFEESGLEVRRII